MASGLTALGFALCEIRRKLGKVLGDQSRDTGRATSEISRIERACVPVPNGYIDEFASWAAVDERTKEHLRSLPSVGMQDGAPGGSAHGQKTRVYIASLAGQFIQSAATSLRRAGKLGNREKFPILHLVELETGTVLPDFELHVEPTGEMPGVAAYVAEFPLRMVISEETYEAAFNNQGRARFTVAHELGHLMLHRPYLQTADSRAMRTSKQLSTFSRCEQQANEFAAELLLPEQVVQTAGLDPDTLSERCDVSKTAAEVRLRTLRLWPKRNERIVSGFAGLLAQLRGQRPAAAGRRKTLVRNEVWGKLIYDFDDDEFRAEVTPGQHPVLKAPIGIGWIILGACNQNCIMCYGNVEELPKGRVSLGDALRIAQAIKDAQIMRVVISGGEPLLYPGIFDIVDTLAGHGVSVVLGTNGTFLSDDNVHRLRNCTRVEISLDAADSTLNNKIRVSRSRTGNAWKEGVAAIETCLRANVDVRVLTTLNALNQHQLLDQARLLYEMGVRDWALSWTVPAGRAADIYDQLQPDEAIVGESLEKVRQVWPSLRVRYSNRHPDQFNRFYFLVLPDGEVATEDIKQGGKQTFGSALHIPLVSVWTPDRFNQEAHFAKWVADRIAPGA
jgi:MoaA/NifB/PqqE/SkfB family radical SAM enzyme